MSQSGRFTDKIVVVTAAGAGIGAATAKRFASEGATVIAIDFNPGVREVAAELQPQTGRTVEAEVLDCTNRAAVETVFQGIIERHGRVDVLVNGVGQSARQRGSEFWESDPEVWDFVLNVSLKSTMLCSRQVVPAMRSRGYGRIVNVSSIAWLAPVPNFSDYAAAKAGVVGFTRVLATELAPFGVTVNAVSPGPVATAALENQPAGVLERLHATIPMKRIGKPEEIASGIVFLASDEASFITGHNLLISGGRAMI